MEKNQQNFVDREKQRFALRKLSLGVVSVLVGTTLFFGTKAQAASQTDNSSVVTKTDSTNPGGVKQQGNDQGTLNDQEITQGGYNRLLIRPRHRRLMKM